MKESKNLEELTPSKKAELKKEAIKEIKKEQLKGKMKNNNDLYNEKQKEEKVKEAFEKIGFLTLPPEQKKEVAEKINNEVILDKLFIIEMLVSIAIVTFGLIQNSAAVVIGAMLIAPILRPINGMSFAIARGGVKILKKSLKLLFTAVFISIFVSYVLTKLIGIEIETQEIIARTNPNVIDFFIALFSGVIGVMSLRFKRLGAGMSGVAMAVALLPPLCVVGIELAFGNYSSSYGAFLLFLSNIIGIILVSTVFFWWYGFTPHDGRSQNKVFHRLIIFFICMISILIPLVTSFLDVKNGNTMLQITRQTVEKNLQESLGKFEVENLELIDQTDDEMFLSIKMKVDYNADVVTVLSRVKKELQKNFEKKLKVEFEIVKVIEF